MSSETDTLAGDAGTDNAHSSDIENPANWNFFDPDDDQDNEDVAAEAETESEEDTEPEEVQADATEEEAEEGEPEPEETPDGEDEGEGTGEAVSDDVKVVLSDGEEVTVKELRDGYFRQSDYSRKTQALATERDTVKAQADRIENTIQAFATFISQQIPEEPPVSLSISNPNEYVHKKATYDKAMAQVEALLALGDEPKSVKGEMSNKDMGETLKKESAHLGEMFPQTHDPAKREAFFKDTFEAAMQLGFSEDEIKQTVDHRHFALAYWAKRGMDADKARKAAKKKVAKAPPVAPVKASKAQTTGDQNRKAMRRLSETGSIQDALLVDFD